MSIVNVRERGLAQLKERLFGFRKVRPEFLRGAS